MKLTKNVIMTFVITGVLSSAVMGMEGVPVSLITLRDRNGETVLHWAARRGHAEIIRKLLAQGMKVDIQNNDGWTPLHVVASKGHGDVVRVLLDGKADITIQDIFGETALDVARANSHDEIVALLKAALASKIDEEMAASMISILLDEETRPLDGEPTCCIIC